MDIKNIINKFDMTENVISVEPFGNGHINDTFLLKTENGDFVLQNLNTKVFKKYDGLSNNITLVTTHINNQIIAKNGHLTKEALIYIPCKDGKYYYYDKGNCYRIRNLIPDSVVYQQSDDVCILQEAGKCLGEFIEKLDNFDAKALCEVIPNFHNTSSRYKDFKRSVEKHLANKNNKAIKEIKFVKERADLTGEIVDKLETGELPLRVTHNDTKLNNILFDSKTNKALCLIDLDTIMPGSLLYDFGDAIRISCSTAEEDEQNLDKVHFNIESYDAFTKGFIGAVKDKITPLEVEMLHKGAIIMTYECGMRFLADYLDGDIYFKVDRESHNLDRARTQFKMVEEMEQRQEEMKAIAYKYYKN